MRRALLLVASLAASGCFLRAQGGYALDVPVKTYGGAHLEVLGGAGDPRSTRQGGLPNFLSLDVVGDVGDRAHRVGLGASAMWVPWSGWERNSSPTIRLGGRFAQVEWLPTGATASFSGVVEVGAMYYPSRASNSREFFTVALGGEVLGRLFGASPGWRLFLLFGYGGGTSLNRLS